MRILVRQFENGNQLSNFYKTLLIISLLLVLPIKGLSQNESSIFSKLEFESVLAQNKTVISAFNSYSKKLNPSIHVENNLIKIQEVNATCLYLDYASIKNIETTIENKSSIEYISIKIKNPSEISSFIGLTRFTNFSNVKYFHIIFEYEISNPVMLSLIKLPLMGCTIIYESRKIM